MEDYIIKDKDLKKYSLAMDSRGFLWIKHKPFVLFELDDAIEQEKVLIDFCENKRVPFLIDIRVHNWNATKEVREFHSKSKNLLNIRKAEGILVNNFGLKMLANFYNRFNNPPNPVKVFTKETEAIKWILKLK